jgi:hypothetical protein
VAAARLAPLSHERGFSGLVPTANLSLVRFRRRICQQWLHFFTPSAVGPLGRSSISPRGREDCLKIGPD